MRQIKHDVGTYVFQHQNDQNESLNLACGGQVAFQIATVKMTVTATLENTGGGSAGLKIPLDLLTIEANASGSRATQNSITTSLEIFPISASADSEFENVSDAKQRLGAPPPPSPEFEGTPITDILNRLRSDLLRTADTPPCFDFGQGDQKANAVKWAFTVTRKAGGGGKLSFALFSIGAEGTQTATYANTIEANFIASGEGFG